MSSLGSRKETTSVGEVSMEHTEQTGFAVFGFSWQANERPGDHQTPLSGRNPMWGGVSEASDVLI